MYRGSMCKLLQVSSRYMFKVDFMRRESRTLGIKRVRDTSHRSEVFFGEGGKYI